MVVYRVTSALLQTRLSKLTRARARARTHTHTHTRSLSLTLSLTHTHTRAYINARFATVSHGVSDTDGCDVDCDQPPWIDRKNHKMLTSPFLNLF